MPLMFATSVGATSEHLVSHDSDGLVLLLNYLERLGACLVWRVDDVRKMAMPRKRVSLVVIAPIFFLAPTPRSIRTLPGIADPDIG